MLTPDTRCVLHRCTVVKYLHVPSTSSAPLGCTVTVRQEPLRPRRMYGSLVIAHYIVRYLVERGVEERSNHARPAQ